MSIAEFEWDSAKEAANVSKHGVSFFEAQLAFADERRLIVEDLAHSEAEARYYCIGRVARGVLTVRFTWRSGIIRIIGAGFWRKEKALYERQGSLHG